MGKLGVAGRLWAAVGLVIVALIGLIAFSGWRSQVVQVESSALIQALDLKQRAAERWSALTTSAVIRLQASVISSDPAVNEAFKDEIASTIAEIGKVQKSFEQMDLSERDKALMAQIAERRKIVLASSSKATEAKNAGHHEAAIAEVKGQFNPAVATYLGGLRDFVTLQETQKAEAEKLMAERRQSTVRIAAVVVLIIIVLLLLGAMLVGLHWRDRRAAFQGQPDSVLPQEDASA